MKSKEFSHVILTRFNTQLMPDGMLYDDIDKAHKWMDRRMPMFREMKDSLLSQEGEFTWVVSLDERTDDVYVKEISDGAIIINCDIRDTFKHIQVDTPWVITSRMDCDDQYRPGFVKKVQDRFEPKIKAIDVRFEELNWKTGWVFSGEMRWSGSMFVSLVEPSDRITTAFCRPHGLIASGYPVDGTWDGGWTRTDVIPYEIIEEPLAYMVCHGGNIANKVRGTFLRTK